MAAEETLIGRYVIVRCRDAGVHAGILHSYQGREAVLLETRRLWTWDTARSITLSAVARYGLGERSTLGPSVECIVLTETCEIIICTHEAAAQIRSHPAGLEDAPDTPPSRTGLAPPLPALPPLLDHDPGGRAGGGLGEGDGRGSIDPGSPGSGSGFAAGYGFSRGGGAGRGAGGGDA